MYCSNCGKQIEDRSKFCEYCGATVVMESRKAFCENCGNELNVGEKFCGNCGTKGRDDNATDSWTETGSAKKYIKLGNDYLDQGKFEKAIESFENAIIIDPNNADAYNNLGWVYNNELKKFAMAIKNYKKAIIINPNNVNAYSNLGIAYENAGNIDKALENHKKAASLGHMGSQKWLKNRQKKPWWKRTWIWVVVVLVVVVRLIVVSTDNGGSSSSRSGSSYSSGSVGGDSGSLKETANRSNVSSSPPVEVTASDLSSDFSSNQVAAEQRYNGKTLIVAGATVRSITPRSNSIVVKVSNGIEASFTLDHKDALSQLKSGQRIPQIKGVCTGYRYGNVILENCTLIFKSTSDKVRIVEQKKSKDSDGSYLNVQVKNISNENLASQTLQISVRYRKSDEDYEEEYYKELPREGFLPGQTVEYLFTSSDLYKQTRTSNVNSDILQSLSSYRGTPLSARIVDDRK